MLFSRKALLILTILTCFTIATDCVSSGVLNNFDFTPKITSVSGTQSTTIIFGFTNGPRNNIINFNFGGPCTKNFICSFSGGGLYQPYASSGNSAVLTLTPINNANDTYLIPFEADVPGICSETGNINITVQGNQTSIPANITANLTATTNIVTNGDVAQYYVDVKNNMPVDTFIELTSINFPLEAQTNYESTLFKLKSNEERTLKVTVFIPAEFPATTPGNPLSWAFVLNDKLFGQQVVLPVNLSIVGTPTDLRLTRAPSSQACVETTRGNEITTQMEFTNYGDYEGPFTAELNLPDQLQNVISVSPQFFSLPKGEKIPFNVTITPSQDTPTNTYPWNLLIKQGDYQVSSYDGCLKIDPNINFTVKYVSDLTIKRNRKSATPIIVENTGDNAKEFSIQYDPSFLDYRFSITPDTFTLNPGESIPLTAWFNTTMSTRLAEENLSFNITDNESQTFTGTYDVKIITSGLDNETLLKVTNPPDQMVPNNTQVPMTINVINIGDHVLNGITINIYSGNELVKTLPLVTYLRPKENRKVPFILRVSSDAYGEKIFTTSAQSQDGEMISQDFQINVVKANPQINLDQNQMNNSMNFGVQNTGNVPLDNIQYFVIDPVSNAVIQAFDSFSLDVGSKKQIQIPTSELQQIQDKYSQPIVIKFTNDNQVLLQQPLPLQPASASSTINPLYLVLIVVVLVGVYFMVIKRYEQEN
ncbi:Uncharacterised protein [uncultured archaeon]|nr:Uncharacterised protein [uncultured archaeon]